ncbi:MAG TPA: hypothetical protein VHY30_05605 [Verrucomicrobiae bacterium]|jgi:hypothetical protein|nr:hypothetical protein [Verrucomicrobiae bacterium]
MNTKPKYRWVNFAAILSTAFVLCGLIVIGLFYLKIGNALNMLGENKIEPAKLDTALSFFADSYKWSLVYCSALNFLLIILGGGILCKGKSNAA